MVESIPAWPAQRQSCTSAQWMSVDRASCQGKGMCASGTGAGVPVRFPLLLIQAEPNVTHLVGRVNHSRPLSLLQGGIPLQTGSFIAIGRLHVHWNRSSDIGSPRVCEQLLFFLLPAQLKNAWPAQDSNAEQRAAEWGRSQGPSTCLFPAGPQSWFLKFP